MLHKGALHTAEQSKEELKKFYDRFAVEGFEAATIETFYPKRHRLSESSAISREALALSCGCGDPLSAEDVSPGCSVVDLGCGGGLDVILAGQAAGAHGRVVGLDFAPRMIEATRRSVAAEDVPAPIHLRVADVENMALLPRGYADLVTANCVICFCPDKLTVYKNIFRILRPGGHLRLLELVRPAGKAESCCSPPTELQPAIISQQEHLEILKKLSFEVSEVEQSFLTEEQKAVILRYPGMDSLFMADSEVYVLSVIAKRRPLN